MCKENKNNDLIHNACACCDLNINNLHAYFDLKVKEAQRMRVVSAAPCTYVVYIQIIACACIVIHSKMATG